MSYTTSEWTIGIRTGCRSDTRRALKADATYGERWDDALIGGDHDDSDDMDSDWMFQIHITGTPELMALMVVLSSLSRTLVDFDVHASFKDEHIGVRGNMTLPGKYWECGTSKPTANIYADARDATRDARVEAAALGAVSMLENALAKEDAAK